MIVGAIKAALFHNFIMLPHVASSGIGSLVFTDEGRNRMNSKVEAQMQSNASRCRLKTAN